MATSDEAAELRREVVRLRARLAELEESPALSRRGGGWWRALVCTVLVVLAAVLAPASVVARWAHFEVSETAQFTALVGPLGDDPAIQTAITDRITGEVTDRLDLTTLANQATAALAERAQRPAVSAGIRSLGAPLGDALEGFIHSQVRKIVASDAFASAWDTAVRAAHQQAVAVLSGEGSDLLSVEGGTVSVNLAPVIEKVKAALVDRGLEVAQRIPVANASFVIFSSPEVVRAQRAFDLLDKTAVALPLLTLAALAGAVAVARHKRRALVAGMLAVAAGMVVLGLALTVARSLYLGALPPDVNVPAAEVVYDAVAGSIRPILRGVLVIALVVALVAWAGGSGPAARQVRRAAVAGVVWLRSLRSRGVSTGAFGRGLWTARVPVRIAIVAVAALVLVMGNPISGGRVIGVVIGAAVVWLVVEILATPPTAGDVVAPQGGVPVPAPEPDV
jgi:hypothetical protein